MGTVLDVSNPAYPGCTTPYVVSEEDKDCASLAARLGLLQADITSANPGLDCSSLKHGLLVGASAHGPPAVHLLRLPPSAPEAQDGVAGHVQWALGLAWPAGGRPRSLDSSPPALNRGGNPKP